MGDEVGKHPVGEQVRTGAVFAVLEHLLHRLGQFGGQFGNVALVVRQQAQADQCQQNRHQGVADIVDGTCATGGLGRVVAEVPLQRDLIAGVGADMPQQAVDEDHQERVAGGEIPTGQGGELLGQGDRLLVPGDGAGPCLGEDHQQGEDRPQEENHELDHIGPDDRADPPEGGVGGRQQPRRQQHGQFPVFSIRRPVDAPPRQPCQGSRGGVVGHLGDRSSGGIDDQPQPDKPHVQEQPDRQQAGGGAEPQVEVLVGTGESQLHIEGDPDPANDQEGEGEGGELQEHGNPLAEDFARDPQVREGGHHRGDQAEAGGPPGEVAVADEELVAGLLRARAAPANVENHRHVQQHDAVVDHMQSPAGGQQGQGAGQHGGLAKQGNAVLRSLRTKSRRGGRWPR